MKFSEQKEVLEGLIMKFKKINYSNIDGMNFIWFKWFKGKYRWIYWECRPPVWWLPKIEKYKHGFRVGWLIFAIGAGKVTDKMIEAIKKESCKKDKTSEYDTKIIEYMKEILTNHNYVDMNPNIIGGMPSIKGTRIPVSLILSCLKDGMKIEDICKDYNLSPEEVIAAIDYVIDIINAPFV